MESRKNSIDEPISRARDTDVENQQVEESRMNWEIEIDINMLLLLLPLLLLSRFSRVRLCVTP